MASDMWNRVVISIPAIQRAVIAPKDKVSGEFLVAINKGCQNVKLLLKNKTLETEAKILHAILYIFHNRLCFHKTYLALKQIEQCLKRLTRMNLKDSIQDLLELCPQKPASQQGSQFLVPSQPVLELISLKILGGCKLLLRLLDCCGKTFHLSIQHLHLEEFIVLNLVVSGLVSRLWVVYQSILKRLASLYAPLFGLLQEVSEVHQMPYIKGFIFPSQIAMFLGPAFSEMKKKLSPFCSQRGATWLLSKLFSEQAPSSLPDVTKIQPPIRKKTWLSGIQTPDVGQPLQQNSDDKGKPLEFDAKTLFKRLKTSVSEDTTLRIKGSKSKNSSRRSGVILSKQELRADRRLMIVQRIQKVESFQELSEELRAAVCGCRNQHWMSEATFLGNTLLKSNRLKNVEALGYRFLPPSTLAALRTTKPLALGHERLKIY
ncbi:nucleolus and neural progenitor protein isoform X2 [Microcaecilia unicolor]|uniref:Nucleolus and neural progenitor protein isoform X2 n=1 Tax=Microcaecilia unicolor TaxID=1415580 RepID=A0A6P7Y2C0_9AMPH|nr:nucleolus and neural progenitor protein isoform X2 [Microcaecilia unicolor]